MDILAGLNAAQKEAVQSLDGPMLILAGAGSGKTKTLTHRIANLLAQRTIQPENILAVTFTNKAAQEMRDRVGELLGQNPHRGWMPFMGTFHSICVRILRQDGEHIGVDKSFVIFDAQDSRSAVQTVMKQQKIDTKQFAPRSVQGIISSAKNEGVDRQAYEAMANSPLQKVASRVWPQYQKVLDEARALDFDDLLSETVRLLSDSPPIKEKWRQQFRYVMIDEYQDTNATQYRLVQLLTNEDDNIAVVGDDWQSIYSWRGADFRNILNFERDYPEATVIKLEQNYRSTKPILDAAHNVISQNNQRSKKKLWTADTGGRPVQVVPLGSERDEGEFIVRTVRLGVEQGRSFGSYAVLYRTNAQSRTLEDQMVRYGIPYRVVGGVRFYDRKEIKDILAYLRLVFQPNDTTSFSRVVNVPSRGIGQTSLAKFEAWQSAQGVSMEEALQKLNEIDDLTARARKALMSFAHTMQDLRTYATDHSIADVIDAIIRRTDYKSFIDDGSVQGQARVENIQELVSVAQEYQDVSMADFLEEVALVSDVDSYDTEADAVTLMTMHAAKGLEFETVFVAGLEEGLFPHSRALFDAEEMEEERRLCYVAMTRAKQELYLLHASRRLLYGSVQHNPPSRFISDVSAEVQQVVPSTSGGLWGSQNEESQFDADRPLIRKGDRVRHPVFGHGTVENIEDEMATVRFQRGSKTLHLAFAPLEKM
jgi:DNA helicase-2/ATP-dependent DNA helicase PcrA